MSTRSPSPTGFLCDWGIRAKELAFLPSSGVLRVLVIFHSYSGISSKGLLIPGKPIGYFLKRQSFILVWFLLLLCHRPSPGALRRRLHPPRAAGSLLETRSAPWSRLTGLLHAGIAVGTLGGGWGGGAQPGPPLLRDGSPGTHPAHLTGTWDGDSGVTPSPCRCFSLPQRRGEAGAAAAGERWEGGTRWVRGHSVG